MKILILTDNEDLYLFIKELIKDFDYEFYFGTSSIQNIEKIDLKNKNKVKQIYKKFDIVFSLHSAQLFPKELFENARCINIHPGFNPHNRGWYPQVFSIINKKPCGITIHEINKNIDDGDIILQEKIKITEIDTSESVYHKILKLEKEILTKNFKRIIENNYTTFKPESNGNLNFKKDYKNLCELDLNHVGSLQEHIDLLRALSHGNYKNAHFKIDNKKIYINLNILT